MVVDLAVVGDVQPPISLRLASVFDIHDRQTRVRQHAGRRITDAAAVRPSMAQLRQVCCQIRRGDTAKCA